jgi:lipid A 3-O-deacylase
MKILNFLFCSFHYGPPAVADYKTTLRNKRYTGMITIQNVFLRSLLAPFWFLNPVFGAEMLEPKKNEVVPHTGEAFAFYIENDTRNIGGPGSDQSYSNGLKFSYIYAEDKLPTWTRPAVDRLQIVEGDPNKTKLNFGISLGHQIYTPNNTGAKVLVSDDRPYAGWLYVGFAASFREEDSGQSFEVDLGMVGPSALGEQVQNNFHDLIQDKRTQGWSHGLHDEPTLQVAYQKRHRILRMIHFDIVPYYGAGFGNILVGAHVGSLIRVGVNLPDDLGPSRPSSNDGDSFVSPTHTSKSVKRLGYYGFAEPAEMPWHAVFF